MQQEMRQKRSLKKQSPRSQKQGPPPAPYAVRVHPPVPPKRHLIAAMMSLHEHDITGSLKNCLEPDHDLLMTHSTGRAPILTFFHTKA
jgi:hypothetical protein